MTIPSLHIPSVIASVIVRWLAPGETKPRGFTQGELRVANTIIGKKNFLSGILKPDVSVTRSTSPTVSERKLQKLAALVSRKSVQRRVFFLHIRCHRAARCRRVLTTLYR